MYVIDFVMEKINIVVGFLSVLLDWLKDVLVGLKFNKYFVEYMS